MRESSVRDDYQVLEGTNRHTITSTGWVQEEENYKLALDEQARPASAQAYRAKELGMNRYERLKDFDFSAGDDYWQGTAAFWADARSVWEEIFSAGTQVKIAETANDVPLFAILFEQAELASKAQQYDSAQTQATLRSLLADYIQ